MKKIATIFIAVILVLALCLMVTGCTIFSGPPSDGPDKNGNNGDNNDNDDNNDNGNDKPKTNPYLGIINSLLDNLSDLDSMEDYINAVSFLLRNLPLENVKNSAEQFLGPEKSELIDTYFDKGLEMLDLASQVLPLLPKIIAILNVMEDYHNSTPNPIIDGIINAALLQIGVTKNGNAYTFPYDGTAYTVVINENVYTVTFDDTTLIITYNSENDIEVIENNILYKLLFNEQNKTLEFQATDIEDEENPLLQYLFEAISVNNNFAFQFYDSQSGSLVQLKTEVEILEATLSVQSEVTELPDSILNGVPANFATEGDIYKINEGLLDEYL